MTAFGRCQPWMRWCAHKAPCCHDPIMPELPDPVLQPDAYVWKSEDVTMGVNHQQFGTYCEICFDALHHDTCAIDQDGTRWDVCPGICARQAGITEQVIVGPPAPYPAVVGDPITEQWWWTRLDTDHQPRQILGLTDATHTPATSHTPATIISAIPPDEFRAWSGQQISQPLH